MNARVIMVFILLLFSKVVTAQASEEEVSFWHKRFMGLEVIEILIAIVAIFAVVFLAYKLSVSKK